MAEILSIITCHTNHTQTTSFFTNKQQGKVRVLNTFTTLKFTRGPQ